MKNKTALFAIFLMCLFATRTISAQDTPGPNDAVRDVYDIADADNSAVMNWIKLRVIATKIPYCYRQSYPRGVGVTANTCPPQTVHDETGGPLGLCYPSCGTGYSGAGPVCWQSCPSGYHEDGGFCAKPAPIGRGSGRIPDISCPKGYWQRGVGTAAWCDNRATWPWDLKTCGATKTCKSTEEWNGALCYPKCSNYNTGTVSYHAVGCCTCSPNCPPDFGADIGVSCTKKTTTRGVGLVQICGPGTIRDETGGPAGLCYPACKSGFHGSGPYCWQDCVNGMIPCGAGCALNTTECVSTTFDQVFTVAVLAANIATFGAATPATDVLKEGEEAIKVGDKTIKCTTKSGKAAAVLVREFQTIETSSEKISFWKKLIPTHPGTTLRYIRGAKTVTIKCLNAKDAYNQAFAEDLIKATSADIAAAIDGHFKPEYALQIKKNWSDISFMQLLGANLVEVTSIQLALVSVVDPTGITGVLSAYAKPQCQDLIPFPTLLQNYNQ